MNYFRLLGLIFGIMALLKPFYMHLLPWDEFSFIEKFYGKKRGFSLTIIVVLGLVLVAFTWYQHFSMDIPYSLILTVLFSLTAIKGLTLLFDYKRFQGWVEKMLQREKGQIVLIDIGVSLLGLVIIIATMILY